MKLLNAGILTAWLAWLLPGTGGSVAASTYHYVLNPGIRFQQMDNFGANDAWSMQKVGAWSETNKNRLADLLFATNDGIGLSCWRFNFGAGINTETIRDPWRTVESFSPAEGKYDWSRQANERWFLRAAKARGVRQFLATFYSPPLWLTRNGLSNLGSDTTSTTNLKPGGEEEYARYITGILTHFRDDPDERERIEFNDVLPVNEPQWDWQRGQEGNRASDADLQRIYVALAKSLKQAGLKTKILGPESGCIPDMYLPDAGAREKWHAEYGDYLRLICGDPAVAAGFGRVISYHSYWSDQMPDKLVPDRRELGRAIARYPGWKIWQSEYCVMEKGRDLTMDTALRVARVIHCDLTLVGASAWQWWSAVANEDFKSGLIYTDYANPGDAETIYESKLLWALGNYSRFIRPGMWRVSLEGRQDVNGLMASAYLDADSDRKVIVLVNEGDEAQPVTFTVRRPAIRADKEGLFTAYVTSAGDNLTPGNPFNIAEGFSVPGRSVVTLVEEAPAAAALGSHPNRQPAQNVDPSAVADPETYLSSTVADLKQLWPHNHTVNLVCHGHSVPAGYARTPEVRTFDAYPYLLHRGLSERFPHAVINVIVTAIGGEDSESGAARFQRDVLSLRPEVVTIDYALNDRRIGLARAEKAWRFMIESALAANVKVILLTPTGDLSANLQDPKDPLNQHAAQIRRLAAEYHTGLVDSLAAFKDYVQRGGQLADLMAQVNHPNAQGHELVAAQLLKWFPAGK